MPARPSADVGRPSALALLGGAVASVALAVFTVVAILGVMVVAGALVPTAGVIAAISSPILYGHGPALLASTLVGSIGAIVIRRRRRSAASAVAVLCVLTSVGLAGLVGAALTTTLRHGGSVNLWRTVLPGGGDRPVDQRIVYGTAADGRPLHLTIQRPPAATTASPIVIWVHGGGWIAGSDLGPAADLRYLADRGWLGASVEYGLARPGHPTWNTAGPDVACALAWVVDHATSLGADPARVVLAGDSAGGQLAVSVAYHAAAGDQVSSCAGTVPVPRAVVGDYPAVDLVDGYEHGARNTNPNLDARYFAVAYTGGTPSQVPDRYRAVSGEAAITRAAPPTLIIAPNHDVLVSPPSLARFVRTARARGVDAALVGIPFANHAFDTFGDGSLGQQVSLSIIDRWAQAHTTP